MASIPFSWTKHKFSAYLLLMKCEKEWREREGGGGGETEGKYLRYLLHRYPWNRQVTTIKNIATVIR